MEYILSFNKTKPRSIVSKTKTNDVFDSERSCYEGRKLGLSAFRGRLFSLKLTKGIGLKI